MSMSFRGKARQEEVESLLCDLIRINSINPFAGELGKDGNGEKEIIQYISRYFDARGIPRTLQEVLTERCNLIAYIKGSGKGALVFEAHVDTVSVDTMTIDPFDPVCKEGRIYGRGSSDCKGSVAAMMYAFSMLKEMNITPPCDLYFVAAADEEYAYRGVLKFLEDGKHYDGAIVGEPTNLQVCIANKGVTRFFITARGKACHSSMPWKGHNAILDMAKLIVKIEAELQPRFAKEVHPLIGPRTLSVTTITGGELVNITPDFCRIQIDVRTLAGDTFQKLSAELQEMIDELRAENSQVDITIEDAYLEDSCMETPEYAPVVQETCAACEKIIGIYMTTGLLCGCDATKFSRAGIPALVFGPGDINVAHTVDEFIEADQLTKATEIYAQLCVDFRADIKNS